MVFKISRYSCLKKFRCFKHKYWMYILPDDDPIRIETCWNLF